MTFNWVATDFADVTDLRTYNRLIREGMNPKHALLDGDNGIGAWGQSTVAGTGPCCALPHPYMPDSGTVRITKGDNQVDCDIRDRGPSQRIDLNPDAVKALGLTHPVKTIVTWELIKK